MSVMHHELLDRCSPLRACALVEPSTNAVDAFGPPGDTGPSRDLWLPVVVASDEDDDLDDDLDDFEDEDDFDDLDDEDADDLDDDLDDDFDDDLEDDDLEDDDLEDDDLDDDWDVD